jgi:hypothetical protein
MRIGRGLLFGIVGAIAISVVSGVLRLLGMKIGIELILGTWTGLRPGPEAFAAGLAMHIALGAGFGVFYAWLFERVWAHGGAATGVILGMLHAALIGMLFGLTPQLHPLVPQVVADPGPYFANAGIAGVLAWFALHAIYGAIVGAGYGHVTAERQWAPVGRL